ncbi:MAG: hypothetical protein IKP10_04185 [Clostridia bacterium]|nr:hypothetical protein [Clostridia bacterium]
MAITGLIMGIVAVIFAFFSWIPAVGTITGIIGLLLGITGIILSALASKKPEKHGVAVAGLVLSIIGTVLCGVEWIACGLCTTCAAASSPEFAKALENSFN